MNLFNIGGSTVAEQYWVGIFCRAFIPIGLLTFLLVVIKIRCMLQKLRVGPGEYEMEGGEYVPNLPAEAPPPPAVVGYNPPN